MIHTFCIELKNILNGQYVQHLYCLPDSRQAFIDSVWCCRKIFQVCFQQQLEGRLCDLAQDPDLKYYTRALETKLTGPKFDQRAPAVVVETFNFWRQYKAFFIGFLLLVGIASFTY